MTFSEKMMDEANLNNLAAPLETHSEPPPYFSYEELHRKCRDIFPIPFDGAKIMVNKGLSTHFQVKLLF